jgi:hypothetical protein
MDENLIYFSITLFLARHKGIHIEKASGNRFSFSCAFFIDYRYKGLYSQTNLTHTHEGYPEANPFQMRGTSIL